MKIVLLAMFLLCGLTAQADDVMKKEKDGSHITVDLGE